MAILGAMPAELRNILYEQLLKHTEGRTPQLHPKNRLALFAVSKQLHDESTSYFYQQNEIAVDALSTIADTATILPPVSDKYLKFLRRLRVHAATGQPDTPSVHKVACRIASLTTIGASFDQLNISITSKLSHLLNSRVDDSIMDTDHPIIAALRQVLVSRVAKIVYFELNDVWFAPGVACSLTEMFDSQLQFFVSGTHTTDLSLLERSPTGRYSNTHLSLLGLNVEDCTTCRVSSATSVSSTPSSLPSSLCSAFADLDTFSVTSFEMGSEYSEDEEGGGLFDECDTSEQPFFTGDDIEEWQVSTLDHDDQSTAQADDLLDLDMEDDEEMEDILDGHITDIMHNLNETAHHAANQQDWTYLANFAPELLLSRHHLGHLI